MPRRRPPSPLWSILVIVAVLWAQVVYAFHGGCIGVPATGAMAMAMATPSSAMHADIEHAHMRPAAPGTHACAPDAPRRDDPSCVAHCSREPGSADVARIPPVPALPPAPGLLVLAAIGTTAPDASATAAYHAPRVRPRGPTGHPAPLLLI